MVSEPDHRALRDKKFSPGEEQREGKNSAFRMNPGTKNNT